MLLSRSSSYIAPRSMDEHPHFSTGLLPRAPCKPLDMIWSANPLEAQRLTSPKEVFWARALTNTGLGLCSGTKEIKTILPRLQRRNRERCIHKDIETTFLKTPRECTTPQQKKGHLTKYGCPVYRAEQAHRSLAPGALSGHPSH